MNPTTTVNPSAIPTLVQATLGPITTATSLGAFLLAGQGATFVLWAPAAREVRLLWGYSRSASGAWEPGKTTPLLGMDQGRWGAFLPGLKASERYMFYVVGPEDGTQGLKRDPYARELTEDPMWPECQCILTDPGAFPWHDRAWKPPYFHELVIYQFHMGTWNIPLGRNHGGFLDAIEKLPYLKDLGINAVQPLPIGEFPTEFSLGYNNVDLFSPETDYGVPSSDPELAGYLGRINALLTAADATQSPYAPQDIRGTANQFRMFVDMCHVHGIAVLLDVVYNHAGGDFGDRSLYFLDQRRFTSQNDSLYFTDRGWAGGLAFALWNDSVTQFLIDNARYFLVECHCDGLRYDEVSVIKELGGESGWRFCQYVTETCRFLKPQAIHLAEHWPVEQAVVNPPSAGGAGFDVCLNDGLRNAVRGALAQAASGRGAFVDMGRIARELANPALNDKWRAVQSIEDHDIVREGREPRVPRLADPSDSRSWYARSRSRAAMGLVLTAPGIPHVFMGQEFLEDKPWSDYPPSGNLIWWGGLEYDKAMIDFLRFTRELLALRRQLPGLTGFGMNVIQVHDDNRIVAFQRWVPGRGQDVVVVASLSESTYRGYALGFPGSGYWREAFNSDVYDNWVNPWGAGNGGGVHADGGPMHGLPASASLVIPANGILVFAK
jgi:1,4-alpha-glucan branching enzyme